LGNSSIGIKVEPGTWKVLPLIGRAHIQDERAGIPLCDSFRHRYLGRQRSSGWRLGLWRRCWSYPPWPSSLLLLGPSSALSQALPLPARWAPDRLAGRHGQSDHNQCNKRCRRPRIAARDFRLTERARL